MSSRICHCHANAFEPCSDAMISILTVIFNSNLPKVRNFFKYINDDEEAHPWYSIVRDSRSLSMMIKSSEGWKSVQMSMD